MWDILRSGLEIYLAKTDKVLTKASLEDLGAVIMILLEQKTAFEYPAKDYLMTLWFLSMPKGEGWGEEAICRPCTILKQALRTGIRQWCKLNRTKRLTCWILIGRIRQIH
jgi:hypothetical protein